MRFLDSIAGWLKPRAATPAPESDFWYEPAGAGMSQAGIRVTPDLALKASAVLACVRVLSETVATLPLRMYRERDDGGIEPAPLHPLDDLLRWQPNRWQTAVEFWQMMMLHAALRGTFYAEIIPGPRGAVDQLHPLDTDLVVPEQLSDGALRFEVRDRKNGRKRVLLQDEVFRVPGLSSDGIRGLRAVDLASEAIGLGLAADQFAGRLFQNNLNIGVSIEHPGKLSPEAQKNLVHALMMRFAGGENAHRPMILQEGMKANRFGSDADKAQLLEARRWQVAEVARFWNIPLFMLGIEDAGKAQAEQQAIDLIKYTLRPWVERIEQAIRRDLITAKGRFVAKFDLDGLRRGLAKDRAEYFSKALGSGGSPAWMTQNEVRREEGLNPVDDPRADMLGVGTNPETSDPPGRRNRGGQASARERAERLVRKEVTAIRRAMTRFAGDRGALESWIDAFFGGHVSDAHEMLGIPMEAARAYCARAKDAVMKTDDLAELLIRWNATGAEDLARALEQNGETNGNDAATAA